MVRSLLGDRVFNLQVSSETLRVVELTWRSLQSSQRPRGNPRSSKKGSGSGRRKPEADRAFHSLSRRLLRRRRPSAPILFLPPPPPLGADSFLAAAAPAAPILLAPHGVTRRGCALRRLTRYLCTEPGAGSGRIRASQTLNSLARLYGLCRSPGVHYSLSNGKGQPEP
jgi:hypothetical protein